MSLDVNEDGFTSDDVAKLEGNTSGFSVMDTNGSAEDEPPLEVVGAANGISVELSNGISAVVYPSVGYACLDRDGKVSTQNINPFVAGIELESLPFEEVDRCMDEDELFDSGPFVDMCFRISRRDMRIAAETRDCLDEVISPLAHQPLSDVVVRRQARLYAEAAKMSAFDFDEEVGEDEE